MPNPAPREKAITFEALLLVVLVARITAHFALPQPLQGEALNNFTLARALSAGQWPLGEAAPHMLHGAGYPLVLAPFFAMFGARAGVAFGVNLLLALGSALLVWAVAGRLGLREGGRKLALLGYGLWLPGIWDCTLLVRENLGTPLLLLSAWLGLRLLREGPRLDLALGAGLAWGAGLLTGAWLSPLIVAPGLALVLTGRRGWRLPVAGAALAAGAGLMLTSWSWIGATLQGMPQPTALALLAAGAAPTMPMGPSLALPDAPTFDATLGRLAMFWWPHFPEAGQDALSRAMTYMRIGEVTQYVALFTLGFAGLVGARTMVRQRLVVGMLILGFWVLGGSRVLGDGYRDPVMPLLIVLSAGVLCALVDHRARAPAR
jgi:hypothetical protein